jgi:uncharacterized protein
LPEYFITDPFFYAVAIPSVLLMGIGKSGFGAGLGSVAMPLMACAVPVPQAAAIMMPLLLAIDILGLFAFKRDFDKELLLFLLPWGMIGVGLGFVLFKTLDAHWVSATVGGLTLLFLAQKFLFNPGKLSQPLPKWCGALLTITSGFTSFIAHSGGPPLNVYVLPLRLSPVIFTSTMAYLFFFINLTKWWPYAELGLLDWKNLGTSIVLMPMVPIGVYSGVRVARHISPLWFYRLVYCGMFLAGCKLLWDGVH